MLHLRPPDVSLHVAWLAAHEEWGTGAHEDGFGLHADDDVTTRAGFAAWTRRLLDQADPDRAAAMGRLPATYRWVVEDGDVLAGVALRHELDGRTRSLGHVGFGVRPSARGRGVASWALGRTLGLARDLGLSSVALVCDVRNVASARTIERAGGVLVSVDDTRHGRTRRYEVGLDRS
ncbi:MAG: GNAT family N-acetyltransferase [Nocardioidaceae bacterium]|nr:GNAT family N-acetyltransferase [Nocardioidaceae bacterium]